MSRAAPCPASVRSRPPAAATPLTAPSPLVRQTTRAPAVTAPLWVRVAGGAPPPRPPPGGEPDRGAPRRHGAVVGEDRRGSPAGYADRTENPPDHRHHVLS